MFYNLDYRYNYYQQYFCYPLFCSHILLCPGSPSSCSRRFFQQTPLYRHLPVPVQSLLFQSEKLQKEKPILMPVFSFLSMIKIKNKPETLNSYPGFMMNGGYTNIYASITFWLRSMLPNCMLYKSATQLMMV